jgi:nicotinate-nucleotide adenylyltransferase
MTNLNNKKIALYGGSFNPIHIGHLNTGLDIIEKLNYDYIIYIPDNIPVHKDSSLMANPKDRLNMLNLSIKGISCFLSSDVEIKRGNFSFTYDTILELKEQLKYNDKFGIIFGDDLLDGLNEWKNINELEKMCDLICLKRKNNATNINRKITFFNNRIIEISSTEIRNRINKNLPIDFMVTDSVKKYIFDTKLYRI